MQKLTKKGGGDIGLCDESRIYGCLIEIWVFNYIKKIITIILYSLIL